MSQSRERSLIVNGILILAVGLGLVILWPLTGQSVFVWIAIFPLAFGGAGLSTGLMERDVRLNPGGARRRWRR